MLVLILLLQLPLINKVKDAVSSSIMIRHQTMVNILAHPAMKLHWGVIQGIFDDQYIVGAK